MGFRFIRSLRPAANHESWSPSVHLQSSEADCIPYMKSVMTQSTGWSLPRLQHLPNEKIGMGYPTSGMVLGWKAQRSRLELGLTAIRRGFELYECLLVVWALAIARWLHSRECLTMSEVAYTYIHTYKWFITRTMSSKMAESEARAVARWQEDNDC